MGIRHVIFDFDGSCTRVQDAAERYLEEYQRLLAAVLGRGIESEWNQALAFVQSRSPKAAWMLGGTPSAPAAADPYILAGEAASLLMRQLDLQQPLPIDLHSRAYEAAPAPFRDDLLEVLDGLVSRRLQVCFVSNSSTRSIERRLDALLAGRDALRNAIQVVGDAGKFRIRELSFDDFDTYAALRRAFESLPAAAGGVTPERPIYLRRGAYFEALCKVWGDDPTALEASIVCGDIWELDLAMPAALGTYVHLITRASPYDTYPYELQAAQAVGIRSGTSNDLRGLLARVDDTAAS